MLNASAFEICETYFYKAIQENIVNNYLYSSILSPAVYTNTVFRFSCIDYFKICILWMYYQKKITKDNIYDFFVKEYIYSSTTAALLKILRTYFTAQAP